MTKKRTSNRKLIVTADDFGLDTDTLRTTINLFEKGAISSATIMTGMPETDAAISYAKDNQDKFSFGLHFNIVDGHAPIIKNNSRTLIDNSGKFHPSNQQRLRALTFRLSHKEIAAELEAQLTCLIDRGLKVSHVDSHGHLHKFPNVIMAMKPVLKRHGITKVRLPQTLYKTNSLPRSFLNFYCSQFFKNINHPDNSYFVSDHSDENWLEDVLSGLPDGITELAIHPGQIEHWRAVEASPFFNENHSAVFKRHQIDLISYLDI